MNKWLLIFLNHDGRDMTDMTIITFNFNILYFTNHYNKQVLLTTKRTKITIIRTSFYKQSSKFKNRNKKTFCLWVLVGKAFLTFLKALLNVWGHLHAHNWEPDNFNFSSCFLQLFSESSFTSRFKYSFLVR
jgi:hypothetical protein